MDKQPKISIIIPVYNVQEYLSACLHSALKQTLFDIEIICVNDGSQDDSSKILEDFSKTDYRISIVNKENGGLSSARNAGMKHANGQLIMFLDSDDMFDEKACERVWREYQNGGFDIITFSTSIIPEFPRASEWYYHNLSIQTQQFEEFRPSILFQKNGSIPFVWRQAYKRELLLKNDLFFDESVGFGEDTVFQAEVFPHAEKFSYICDHLYFYRWYRIGSLMEKYKTNLKDKFDRHLYIVKKILEYWDKERWIASYGEDLFAWIINFLQFDGYLPDKEQKADAIRMLKSYDCQRYIKKRKVRKEYRSFLGL